MQNLITGSNISYVLNFLFGACCLKVKLVSCNPSQCAEAVLQTVLIAYDIPYMGYYVDALIGMKRMWVVV